MRMLTVAEIPLVMDALLQVLDQPGADAMLPDQVWAQVQALVPGIDLSDVDMASLMLTEPVSAPE